MLERSDPGSGNIWIDFEVATSMKRWVGVKISCPAVQQIMANRIQISEPLLRELREIKYWVEEGIRGKTASNTVLEVVEKWVGLTFDPAAKLGAIVPNLEKRVRAWCRAPALLQIVSERLDASLRNVSAFRAG